MYVYIDIYVHATIIFFKGHGFGRVSRGIWKGLERLKGLGKLYNYIIISKVKEAIFKKRNSGNEKHLAFSVSKFGSGPLYSDEI